MLYTVLGVVFGLLGTLIIEAIVFYQLIIKSRKDASGKMQSNMNYDK